jgi:hypothetical protein
MEEKNIIYFGIWSVVALAIIFSLLLVVMEKTSPVGAFSSSGIFDASVSPYDFCYRNGCDYMGHVFPDAVFGPGRVDCLCNGEVKTFQLLSSDLDKKYSYYP